MHSTRAGSENIASGRLQVRVQIQLPLASLLELEQRCQATELRRILAYGCAEQSVPFLGAQRREPLAQPGPDRATAILVAFFWVGTWPVAFLQQLPDVLDAG